MSKKQGDPGKRYSKEVKAEAIARYQAGQSPEKICRDLDIKRPSFFRWIKSVRKPTKQVRVKRSESPKSDSDTESSESDSDTFAVPAPVTVELPKVNYFQEYYASTYDYDRAQMQAAAINGYWRGMFLVEEALGVAQALEDPRDRMYGVLACVKEQRMLQDRIIKVFSEVTTSSDEYERLFGRLFNITPKEEEK